MSCHELSAGELLSIRSTNIVATGTQFQHIVILLTTDSIGIIDVPVGTTNGNHLCAQFSSLLHGAPCHVTESTQCNGLPLHVESVGEQHLIDEVEGAISRSLRSEDAATPLHTLAGDDAAMELTGEFLVLSEEESYLAASDTDITGGDILIRANVFIELTHESLAKTHYFSIAATARSKV